MVAQPSVDSVISETELLPRWQRLPTYEGSLGRRGIPASTRRNIITAFAGHAQRVSPLYLRTARKWNSAPWHNILQEGWLADPEDEAIAWAYCQLLINEGNVADALPVAAAFRAAHPKHHHANAWFAACNSPSTSKPIPMTFPLHFCVLTRNPSANRVATEEQCKRECEILNETFRTLDGEALAEFTFKSFTPFRTASRSECAIVEIGDSKVPYNSDAVARAFNACTDVRIRDRGAINVYIYDSYSFEQQFRDTTSHGKRNSNRPYLLLDWQRLNNQGQNAEAHEMGHAFGLDHVGVPSAKRTTSTNIMTSVTEGFGSGGKRDLGFTPAQSALIQYHAKRTSSHLGLP